MSADDLCTAWKSAYLGLRLFARTHVLLSAASSDEIASDSLRFDKRESPSVGFAVGSEALDMA